MYIITCKFVAEYMLKHRNYAETTLYTLNDLHIHFDVITTI